MKAHDGEGEVLEQLAAGLWIDEIYSLMVANTHPYPEHLTFTPQTVDRFWQEDLSWQPMSLERLIEMLSYNVHMPLFYILLNPWLGLFGTDVAGLLTIDSGAGVQVADEKELLDRAAHLLRNDIERIQMGRAAKKVVEEGRGATERNVAAMAEVLGYRS